MAGSLPWPAEPLTPRSGRVAALLGVAFLLVALGAGAWAVVRPSVAAPSAHGCVDVVVAMATGGSVMHECGTAARTLCATEAALHDAFAQLVRPQCRLAGIGATPAPARAPAPAGASPGG